MYALHTNARRHLTPPCLTVVSSSTQTDGQAGGMDDERGHTTKKQGKGAMRSGSEILMLMLMMTLMLVRMTMMMILMLMLRPMLML